MNLMPPITSIASIAFSQTPSDHRVYCQGPWTLVGIDRKNLNQSFQQVTRQKTPSIILDMNAITTMDSSGAWQLYQWMSQLSQQGKQIDLIGLAKKHQILFEMIQTAALQLKIPTKTNVFTGLAQLGKKAFDQCKEAQSFLYFIGEVFSNLLSTLWHPRQLRISSLFSVVERTGFAALGIIGLLSFMIGIVLTYQIGLQLKNFGATLFIIDLLGLSILREFAPLLTAIMIAGRSGSAFTAQLGVMKIKEEIDALSTMGVLPNQLLILPRILGLLIALPLLTVWADIFGLLGGMTMTRIMLHINYTDFLQRFPEVVSLSSLLIGLGKAPVFALIISSIACFQGLQVSGNTDSVGIKTTRSVVQAIFFIIVADAFFSILFSQLNI